MVRLSRLSCFWYPSFVFRLYICLLIVLFFFSHSLDCKSSFTSKAYLQWWGCCSFCQKVTLDKVVGELKNYSDFSIHRVFSQLLENEFVFQILIHYYQCFGMIWLSGAYSVRVPVYVWSRLHIVCWYCLCSLSLSTAFAVLWCLW